MALAAFDSNGFNYTPSGGGGGGGSSINLPGGIATRDTTVTATITLPTSPPLPPANLVPASIVIGGAITGTNLSRPTQGTAMATFTIPAGAATGAQNVVVTFNPGPTYTLTGGVTIQ
jgi:hypothetical protein